MSSREQFGRSMRSKHFQFSPTYTPLNHGSFGAYPAPVRLQQAAFQTLSQARPDTFIVYDLPKLIDESRHAIAPLLGAGVDEVVFVPNASTAVNTVLRNLKWSEGDVVVHFSTIYAACEKTLASIKEHEPLETVSIPLVYPIEDEELVRLFRSAVQDAKERGKNVRLSLFDTVSTFPGARMPWEELVRVCREMDVLSLIDGAHGIGHIDLKHLGQVGPDFFVSNCHKWLYTPRGCSVFYVPTRNQQLIRTCLPTSHGYQYPKVGQELVSSSKTPFVLLFEFVATMDYTPWLCVPAALDFRREICGGEEEIRSYCWELARVGGKRVAEILDTEVLGAEESTVRDCCFVNVKLPLNFHTTASMEKKARTTLPIEKGELILEWLRMTAVKEFDTYLQIAFYAGFLWVRLSAQIYLDLEDFAWVGHRLRELCDRVNHGDGPLLRAIITQNQAVTETIDKECLG